MIPEFEPKKKRGGSIIVSASVSPEFFEQAKKNRIGWSEALRVGISIILAEMGIQEYDNRLNIYRKMNLFRQKAEESLAKVEELQIKLDKREQLETPTAEEEADNILNVPQEIGEVADNSHVINTSANIQDE